MFLRLYLMRISPSFKPCFTQSWIPETRGVSHSPRSVSKMDKRNGAKLRGLMSCVNVRAMIVKCERLVVRCNTMRIAVRAVDLRSSSVRVISLCRHNTYDCKIC